MRRSEVAALVAAVSLCACSETKVERRGAPQQRLIGRVIPASVPALRQAILRDFPSAAPVEGIPFSRMIVIELQPPNYPPDWFATWTDPGGFLDVYRQLPASVRTQDLLIEEPTGDVYWPSEYETGGAPVKFHCGFIVHFEERAGSTLVQVFEKVPTIWAGEHWALLHEGIGYGRVHDIRFVEPTVKDRLAMLDAIAALKP